MVAYILGKVRVLQLPSKWCSPELHKICLPWTAHSHQKHNKPLIHLILDNDGRWFGSLETLLVVKKSSSRFNLKLDEEGPNTSCCESSESNNAWADYGISSMCEQQWNRYTEQSESCASSLSKNQPASLLWPQESALDFLHMMRVLFIVNTVYESQISETLVNKMPGKILDFIKVGNSFYFSKCRRNSAARC